MSQSSVIEPIARGVLPPDGRVKPSGNRDPRLPLYLILVISISITTALGLNYLLGDRRLVYPPLHATIEALGAFAAVLVAIVLVRRRGAAGGRSFLLAMGFLGMGLLDGFHAAAPLGTEFVALHSLASLTGATWFALVWLPTSGLAIVTRYRRWIPGGVIVVASSVLLFSLVGSGLLPMLRDGRFTTAAVTINMAAGMLFMIAALRLMMDDGRHGEAESSRLTIVAVLFGVAGLTFAYSLAWSGVWWFWHAVRLTAYLLVVGLIYGDFRKDLSNLRMALAQSELAERRLLLAQETLELRIEERTTELTVSNETLTLEVDERNVLECLLALALEDITLDEQLQRSLQVILSAPFMAMLPKGGIFLADQDRQELVLKASQSLPDALQELCARVPFGECLCGQAAASGDLVFADKVDRHHSHRYEGLVPHGHYNVPILTRSDRGTVLGLIVLYLPEGHHRQEREVQFLTAAANTLAGTIERKQLEEERSLLAAENVRLYEEQRNIADTLQEALLSVPQRIAGVEYGYLYRSATEAARVGGDFYDIFELDSGRIGVLVGDVSGKGIEAATITSTVKTALKAFSFQCDSPAEVIAKTNDLVMRVIGENLFITLFFGILEKNTGRLVYCSAGHPEGIVKWESGVSRLVTDSPVMAGVPGLQYSDREQLLEQGDILVLYTDGVTEARNERREFFGEEQLVDLLASSPTTSARQLPERLFRELLSFTGGNLGDDIAILSVSLTG